MRQAIIIKNPKWEPFTAASDAFKKLDAKEKAILVVRGRCKEKRSEIGADKVVKTKPETAAALEADLRKTGAKPEDIKKAVAAFKPLAKAVAVLALLLGICLPSFAQQSLIAYLPATSVTSFSTNWTAGTGLIGINRDQVAVFQLTATATNTLASGNTIVRLDTSDNGTDWLTNQVTIAATNNATAIARMTNSIGSKWWRVGGVSNLGTGTTNDSTIVRFSISQ